MCVLGVDPGFSGALAVVDDGELIAAIMMPVIRNKKFKGKDRIDVALIRQWLELFDIKQCYFESVHAMPSQGVSSTFRFGYAAGMAEASVLGMGIPVELVTPQAWKKHHDLIGTEKDASRMLAQSQFPEAPYFNQKAKGQAMADAALIATYGEQHGR